MGEIICTWCEQPVPQNMMYIVMQTLERGDFRVTWVCSHKPAPPLGPHDAVLGSGHCAKAWFAALIDRVQACAHGARGN